ncbi:hypothetical protein [Pelagibacterium lacus]|uniref:hypothetical protein n=1 Tax=Pelagibacterium lacus TaxID=2282655 RepID=UPI0011C035B3|nr:hypothetical protein [Pelagibacterium lacus]
MVVVTVCVSWLASGSDAWWLAPVVVTPAFILAIIMAHDMLGLRLWIDGQGVTYRGLGYCVDAPWDRIAVGRDPQGKSLTLIDPSASTAGWFGVLFSVAHSLAPGRGRAARYLMRSVPLYCFDQIAVAAAIRRYAPDDLVH